MSQTQKNKIENPFFQVQQIINNGKATDLISFIIKLARQYNLFFTSSFEMIYPEPIQQLPNGIQIIYINAYLKHYIVKFSINNQNKVTFSITPAIQVECGGVK